MNSSLTPGVLYSLWEIVYFLNRSVNCKVNKKQLLSTVDNVLYSIGNKIIIESSLELGLTLGLFNVNQNDIQLAKDFINKKFSFVNFEDNKFEFFRFVIEKSLLIEKPYWLAFLDQDLDIFSNYIPQIWVDLFNSAHLFDMSLKENRDWWEKIQNKLHEFDVENKKAIGDFGEELTINHELERLTSDQISNLDLNIKWVSKVSDYFGFDVLSVFGSLDCEDMYRKLKIEVKSSKSSDLSRFRFIVTRNEWEIAMQDLNSYYFYCWLGVNADKRSFKFGPKKIPASSLVDIFPIDQDPSCKWLDTQLIIDCSRY